MLDISLIRKKPEVVKEGLKARNFNPKIIGDILELDKKSNLYKKRIEELRHEKKINSSQQLDENQHNLLKHKKATIKTLNMGLGEYADKREKLLLSLPNIPAPDVKAGKTEKENEIVRVVGKKSKFNFEPKDYLTLARKLDLIDLEQAGQVSGSRFSYLKGKLVDLQMALLNYGQDFLRDEGFTGLIPPLLIKDEVMKGLGYIEGIDEKEKYHLEKDGLYLVGTAEQSLIPYHQNQTLAEEKLPCRYFAFTPAFRREAGSYGKDTKGILRVHQFDKLEMVSFSPPDQGDKEQDYLLSIIEKLMSSLKISYRIVKMCTGDLVFPAARTYDLESWLPGQKIYRETHSCSTCTDFQARRLNIKMKDTGNKTHFLHTLNCTVFAMGRTLVAILENCQTKGGSIIIPEVLQKYTGFSEIK